MKKPIFSALAAALLLLHLTACGAAGGASSSLEVMQTGLADLAAVLPGTETRTCELVPLDSEPSDNPEGQPAQCYLANYDLTWNEEAGRFSTEKALDRYSRQLAFDAMQSSPSIVRVDITWLTPYHSTEEVAMGYTFERRKDAVWQTSVSDRFTDGSFGADAFLEAPVTPVAAAVKVSASPVAALTSQALVRLTDTLPPTAEQAALVSGPSRALTAPPAQPVPSSTALSPLPTEQPLQQNGTEQPTPAALEPPRQAAAVPASAADNPPSAAEAESAAGHTIYITRTGKRYHYDNHCNGGTYYESTLAEAERLGLTPCQKCVL